MSAWLLVLLLEAKERRCAMIQVEGYKAFRGTMQITPKNPMVPQQKIHGDWLYKPEHDCWYGRGQSFMAEICEVITDET